MEKSEKRDLQFIKKFLETQYCVSEFDNTHRLAFAVYVAHKRYVTEIGMFKTAKDLINTTLKEIPYQLTYSALERSLYRTLKIIFADNYSDLRKALKELAIEYEKSITQ
ncbi:MAG: hypothetical protein M0R51_12960 [Clostridia bacterium]|jgi:hypothetical protein|nr:hypothetical protein [Clostridia bacterium]